MEHENGMIYKSAIKYFYEKMYPVSGSNMTHTLTGTLYRARPEIFEIMGGIHHCANGERTYITVRIHVSNDYYINTHLYGTLRGGFFKITQSETFIKENGAWATYSANFVRTPMPVYSERTAYW
jgi:hypothetical protein